MVLFEVKAQNVEVNGPAINSVIDGFGMLKSLARKLLKDEGIVDLSEGTWYPQQKWLNVFKKLSEEAGTYTLFNIGLKIYEYAEFPPGIATVEDALKSLDVTYHMNHRKDGQILFDGSIKSGIGNYHYASTGANSAIMTCDNPYPPEFVRGVIEGIGKKFASDIKVVHDNTANCRSKGGNACTYTVTW